MLREILYIIGLYFLYKFIFDFIVPLFSATRQMQQNIRSMQQNIHEQQSRNAQQAAGANQPHNNTEKKVPQDDYIDFEEVK